MPRSTDRAWSASCTLRIPVEIVLVIADMFGIAQYALSITTSRLHTLLQGRHVGLMVTPQLLSVTNLSFLAHCTTLRIQVPLCFDWNLQMESFNHLADAVYSSTRLHPVDIHLPVASTYSDFWMMYVVGGLASADSLRHFSYSCPSACVSDFALRRVATCFISGCGQRLESVHLDLRCNLVCNRRVIALIYALIACRKLRTCRVIFAGCQYPQLDPEWNVLRGAIRTHRKEIGCVWIASCHLGLSGIKCDFG